MLKCQWIEHKSFYLKSHLVDLIRVSELHHLHKYEKPYLQGIFQEYAVSVRSWYAWLPMIPSAKTVQLKRGPPN